MDKRWTKRLTGAVLVMTLNLGPMTSGLFVYAAESQDIGSITVNDNSLFELNQVTLLPGQSDSTVTFTLTIRNNGNTDLSFMDYWIRLKSTLGSEFNVGLMPKDKGKNRVTPHSFKQFTYYAKVDSDTRLQDLSVAFYKLDFSQPNFERSMGKIPVPTSYSGVTAAGESALINLGGNNIKAKINEFLRGKNEKFYLPSITLNLENDGGTPLSLSEYQFFIRTPEGQTYPLETKNGKEMNISPKQVKELYLSGSIPSSIDPDDWELLITQHVVDLKMNTLVSALKLPSVIQPVGGEIGQEYQFSNKSGLYTAQLTGIHRLPLEDQDILNATVKLSNKGDDTLPIPDMTAYFLLDNSVKVDAKLVITDKVIGIDSKTGIDIQAIGKIPYTSKYSQVKLVLQEKEDDTQTTDLLELSAQADLQAVPSIGPGSSFIRDDIGRKSQYTISSVNTYTGPAGDLLSAELEVDNLEARFAKIGPLIARFLAADGTVFPAQVSEITDSIGPNGKVRFHVWATLPKGYSTENMQIFIGDAVTLTVDDKQTDSKPDAYMKAVAFGLPTEKNEVKDTLKNIELFPYMISLSKINTSINTGKFNLKFDYEITKNSQTVSNTDGHKLVLVFEDHSGNVSFERKYNLKDFEASDEIKDGQVSDNQLSLGKKPSFTITVNDEDLIFKTEFLKKYNLSIYDEFQGQRKLLGKQSMDWFTYSD